MDEAALSRLLQGLTGKEPDWPEESEGATRPGPSCVPLSRMRTAALRENWSPEEQRHLAGCTYCRKADLMARQKAWHPSLVHLYWHARGLFDGNDGDVAHHLQKDACRRCLRLCAVLALDRILGRPGRDSPRVGPLPEACPGGPRPPRSRQALLTPHHWLARRASEGSRSLACASG